MAECLTFHYDSPRSGHGGGAPSGSNWHKQLGISLNSPVRGAPLVAHSWTFQNGPYAGEMHNMVYIATSDNHVYAFAESHLVSGYVKPIWSVCLGSPVTRTGSNIPPPLGVCSTPVLDPGSLRLFVCSYQDIGNNQSVYKMFALDMDTGAVIDSAVLHDAGSPGRSTFDASLQDQRGSLNLVDGYIYATFAAFYAYDIGNYRGWVVGCNANNLKHQSYFSTTKNVLAGGAWGPGGVASSHGALYVAAGNATTADGTYWASLAPAQYPGDLGDFFIAVVKLEVGPRGQLLLQDWFQPTKDEAAPDNLKWLNDNDYDLGSSSCLALPTIAGMRLLVLSAKYDIYLLDQAHLGHGAGDLWSAHVFGQESHSAPAYYHTPSGDHYVYFSGGGSPGLICYKVVVSGGAASLNEVWRAAGGTVSFNTECSSPTVASVGAPSPYALVWVADGTDGVSAVLHAYDALTGDEVYNSSTSSGDDLGETPHYPGVTCVEKSVYVGTKSGFALYHVSDATVAGLVMAWKGIEGDDGIYFSSFDGSNWAAQQSVAGVGTSHGPSLAVFRNRVYMAWKGIEGDDGIYYSSFDGNHWTPQQNVAGVGTSLGPSLALCNGWLFMAWKGVEGDDGIYYSYFDGNNWASQQNVAGVGTSHGPSLASFQGKLYMAWKGIEGDDGIYYSRLEHNQWIPQQNIAGVGTSIGPSLTAFNGNLSMAWKGIEGDDGIYFSIFDASGWALQGEVSGVGTSQGPSLAVFRDRMYMAWKGIEGDDGIYYSYFDGAGWAAQQNVGNVGTSIGPSLAWIGL